MARYPGQTSASADPAGRSRQGPGGGQATAYEGCSSAWPRARAGPTSCSWPGRPTSRALALQAQRRADRCSGITRSSGFAKLVATAGRRHPPGSGKGCRPPRRRSLHRIEAAVFKAMKLSAPPGGSGYRARSRSGTNGVSAATPTTPPAAAILGAPRAATAGRQPVRQPPTSTTRARLRAGARRADARGAATRSWVASKAYFPTGRGRQTMVGAVALPTWCARSRPGLRRPRHPTGSTSTTCTGSTT